MTANQGGPTPTPTVSPSGTPSDEFTGKYEEAYAKFLEKNYADAILVLNEYGIYYQHPYHEIRRQALLSLLESLVYHGVPIHALGIQSHLSPNSRWGALDVTRFGAFLNNVSALGLKIMITEFDVNDDYLPADIATRDQMVCDAAQQYLDLVLAQRSCISLQTWGSTDRYCWLNWSSPRSPTGRARISTSAPARPRFTGSRGTVSSP